MNLPAGFVNHAEAQNAANTYVNKEGGLEIDLLFQPCLLATNYSDNLNLVL